MPIFRSSAVVLLTVVVACVAGAPSRIQDSNIVAYMDAVLSRAEVDKAMGRNQEPLGEPEFQNYNSLLDGDLMRLERTSLDSLSGATFGQSKKFDPSTLRNTRTMYSKPVHKIRVLGPIVPKRNFDEIDRTNFDSFVKKNHIELPKQVLQSRQSGNFDEIDRGFDDFGRRRFTSD